MRFREVTTREEADALRDAYLEVEAARELAAGEYYWHEVIGAAVSTTAGEDLGIVHDIFRAGETEVYAVRGGQRGEVLVPAVRGIVVQLDPSSVGLVVNADALDLPPIRERRPRGRRSSRAGSGGAREPEASEGAGAEPAGDP